MLWEKVSVSLIPFLVPQLQETNVDPMYMRLLVEGRKTKVDPKDFAKLLLILNDVGELLSIPWRQEN